MRGGKMSKPESDKPLKGKPEEVRVLACRHSKKVGVRSLKEDCPLIIEFIKADEEENEIKCLADRKPCDAKPLALYDPETHKLVEVK
jgi:hypothetical protein